jgi:hypothetical protein
VKNPAFVVDFYILIYANQLYPRKLAALPIRLGKPVFDPIGQQPTCSLSEHDSPS